MAETDMAKVCSNIRRLLEEAVRRNLGDGILLSGGLDTSILVYLASKHSKFKAFTVALEGTPAPDIQYAKQIAQTFRLDHHVHIFDREELFRAIPAVVNIMRSFDPMEIRNDVAVYIGLRQAYEDGVNSVMTGDGGDELFAGYSFLFEYIEERLDIELQKIWRRMSFSSIPLAKELGVEARLPYLDPKFKAYAMSIPPHLKVRKDRSSVWGKWILRKAFESHLPEEVVWRVKTPVEAGSGTTALTDILSSSIPNQEFEDKRRRILERDGVRIRDKEQLFYYEAYRSLIGIPQLQATSEGKPCPHCKAKIPPDATYCKICGTYPV